MLRYWGPHLPHLGSSPHTCLITCWAPPSRAPKLRSKLHVLQLFVLQRGSQYSTDILTLLLLIISQVIYVSRNPKDVAVSFYHFHKMANFFPDPGSFSEFLNQFLEGTCELMSGQYILLYCELCINMLTSALQPTV